MIKGCIRKDRACQYYLFEKYAGKMLLVCQRYAVDSLEAEDILQDAFVKVFLYIAQFKFEGSFEGWIRRIVVNTALKHLQKKKLKFSEVDSDKHESIGLEPNAYTHLGENDLMKMIHELPEGYRIVFCLNVIEGYSHEEIAAMLNIKDSTSRSQLVKARRMLQKNILSKQKTVSI